MLLKRKKTHRTFRPHVVLTLLVGGMLTLVMAQARPVHAQGYSDWSKPVNLGSTINSASIDNQPAISRDGLSLYFSSTRPGGFGGNDLWVSQRSSVTNPWGSPVNLGPTINTTVGEGNPAFSRDGHFMFFQTDRSGGFGSVDIWVSRREHTHDDFGWQAPVNLGAGVNASSSDNAATYFGNDDADGPQLYFGSNRLGGLGVFDIYLSEQMADGSFGPAVLVPELSSPLNDTRPSIRQDGLEMFIHSDRTGSLAFGNDLWVSTRATTTAPWSTPVNLGEKINSPSLDQHPYISTDGLTLFFSSDRPGGFGGPDLYVITRSKLCTLSLQ